MDRVMLSCVCALIVCVYVCSRSISYWIKPDNIIELPQPHSLLFLMNPSMKRGLLQLLAETLVVLWAWEGLGNREFLFYL